MTAGPDTTSRAGLRSWRWAAAVGAALTLPLVLAPTLATLLGWRLDSVITRTMMVLGGAALLLRFGLPSRAWWRQCFGEQPWRGLPLALLVTLICCAGYSLVLIGLHAESLRPEVFRPDRLATALATGLLVSLIEEPVFRGALLPRLALGGRFALGATLSSGIYALAHYVRPDKVPSRASYDLSDSLAVYADMLGNLLEPLHDPAPFLGLLLLGLLLCVVVRRRGLGWTIGIHAGLVYYIKTDACLLYWNHGERHWLYGSESIKYDGALFWGTCVGFLLALNWWLRRHPRQP